MAGILQHLRSSTLDKRPNPASMVDGQVAINYASGAPGMFFKNNNGDLVKVGPVHVGSSAPNASPASGGTAGNSVGEQWLDNSGGTYVFKIWDGSAWRSEAGEFVNATGDTMTGNLVMNDANIVFEGSTDDGFETTLTVTDPTADRTITLPNVTGTVVTTGDTGTVTSTMIADGTIVNADINASAAIAPSKIGSGALPSGVTVASANIVDGTIVNADVNASAAIAGTKINPDFGSQTIETTGVINAGSGTAAAPSVSVGTTDNGLYSPGADQVALSTNGTGRLFVDASGRVGVGGAASAPFNVITPAGTESEVRITTSNSTAAAKLSFYQIGAVSWANSITASTGHYQIQVGSTTAYQINRAGTNVDSHIFSTNSTERLRITSAGLVGIGTSSPSHLLHVNGGNGIISGDLALGTTDLTTDLTYSRKLKISGTGPAVYFEETDTSQSYSIGALGGNLIVRDATALAARIVLTSTGNVGIGTTSPGNLLSLAGSIPRLEITDTTTSARFLIDAESGTGGVTFRADQDNAVANTSMAFAVDASEAMRIDSSGNVGIGTSSPATLLHIAAATPILTIEDTSGATASVSRTCFLRDDDSFQHQVRNSSGTFTATAYRTDYNATGVSAHRWNVGNTSEAARIDSSGRLLVGTSTAVNTTLIGAAALQVAGTTNATAQASISRFSGDGDKARLAFLKSRSGAVGTNTIVLANDTLGEITFHGADGSGASGYPIGAWIRGEVDGTPGTDDMPGRLVFSTTADGASSPTERMRISNGGVILFNQKTVAPDASNGGFALSPSTNERMLASVGSTSTAAQNLFLFYNPNGLVGTITTNGSATAYNTSSDYRLKENIVPVTDGITRLQQLKPSRFNFIADPTKTVDGFLAHEVQTVVPEAITGEKDAVDEDGNPQYQGIDQSKLVPLLTAALQEAVAEINALKDRLTAAGI